ncbi:MAG: ROK family transcriptional regulator [Bacteroidota bacterium]|nr:ROK family transcriptional regulator [Bacteroidota bacterium]
MGKLLMWDVIHQRSALIREPNEVRILRLVRDQGPISRIELARLTGLNKSTVTDLVVKLMQTGFLEETGIKEAHEKVGRKRVLLKFLPLAGIVAGIDIGMLRATIAIADLNARILQQETFSYSLTAPAEEVIAQAAVTIRSLLTAAGFPSSKLVGIGIGVQGLIDYTTNALLFCYNKPSWHGKSLSAHLESQFNVPVIVENDVKTMALGEYLLGAAKGTKNFVHLFVGDGIGAGIIVNGHLYRGFTSSAGEVGYTPLDVPSFYKEKFPLTYRNQSIFGEILTNANFIESYLKHAPRSNDAELTVAAIVQSAKNGDTVAMQVIEEFTSLLSILCINIVNTLNPEIIIVGGQIIQHYPHAADMLREKIHKDLLAIPAEAVRVTTAKHGENGILLGAAGLILYELFEPLHTVSLRAARRQHVAVAGAVEQ